MNESSAARYRATRGLHEGHPNAAGVDADVAFTDVGATVEDRVDAAYRDKYRRCAASIVDSMNCPGAAEPPCAWFRVDRRIHTRRSVGLTPRRRGDATRRCGRSRRDL
ncbi:DUF2255 family protein [Nocardia aurea]|uniref:DUF2255 family protein n=1 Tax=Nocardia aurea TaxID=2144174 RepID=UPI00339E075D